jgi:SAM-dependent methyltransferase
MSDGPSKLVPEAEPLDEIILGDDEAVPDVAPAPPARVASAPPPINRGSSRPGERPSAPAAAGSRPPPDAVARPLEDLDPQARKRAKLTLRIPDDEVARPTAVVTDTKASGMSPDDTLELPTDQMRARHASELAGEPVPRQAIGLDLSNEPGWTPFQPAVDDRPATPPMAPSPPAAQNGEATRSPRDTHEEVQTAPISEEIPVELSDIADTPSDEIQTHPRLPATLDSEEIKIDEGDRTSETGEFEIAMEDVMSVESMPGKHLPPPVKTPTATALMAGVAPPPAPSRPQANARPPETSTSTPPPTHQPPTGSSPDLRRAAEDPLIFVPPVGALAPPPMTDTAAHRKKTRPWWEELFNDDFIRTMAKVTDAQIEKEVVFIEESLGCEAGAMILDLACGTGRHAVELAARGYQVVGFDLSLAMLARASDEAQDRNQKINFVQGDMREMTFEETFDGVYAWNTSFGYFDEEKNSAVIARVHKALKKGGQFLLDVVNRDYIVRQAPSLAWFEGDGCICMDEMGIDFITSRMKVKRTLMMDDGRTKEIEYSLRIYSLHELGKMLHDNGFRVAEVSGRTGTPGVFFGCESPRTLILAEKR